MKKTIIGLPLIFLPLLLAAQMITLGPYAVYQAVDSNIQPSRIFIDCQRQQNVAVEWRVKHSGTATAAEGILFRPSYDGTNVSGTTEFFLVVTPTSGTAKSASTNWNVAGYPYLVCTYITNKDADTYSTNTFYYWIKKNAP